MNKFVAFVDCLQKYMIGVLLVVYKKCNWLVVVYKKCNWLVLFIG